MTKRNAQDTIGANDKIPMPHRRLETAYRGLRGAALERHGIWASTGTRGAAEIMQTSFDLFVAVLSLALLLMGALLWYAIHTVGRLRQELNAVKLRAGPLQLLAMHQAALSDILLDRTSLRTEGIELARCLAKAIRRLSFDERTRGHTDRYSAAELQDIAGMDLQRMGQLVDALNDGPLHAMSKELDLAGLLGMLRYLLSEPAQMTDLR